MKRYERICSLLLAMLLLLGALAACKDQPTPEPGSTEDTTTTEAQTQPPERDPITYTFEDGILDEVVDDKPIEEKPDEHYEYVQDFSAAIGGNDPDWYLNEMADISDGNLTAYNNQHPYLALKKKAKADLVTLCVDLQANRPGAIPNDSAYIALRLPAYDNQFAAVGQNGIWLAFQCGKVGIIDTWPGITFFDCGVDFTKTQQVIVEDNQKDNVILVYVQENDTKELVFKVEIRDNKNVTVTDKNGAPKITSKFGYDIPASGFMALWAHQDNGGVVFDNLKVNWTVPGNPTMTKTSSYAQDFNASIAGDEYWSHNATAVFEDGMVVGTNEHCYLDMTRRVRADKVYVELDMLADRKGTVDNVASYVGLRVTERDQFRATGPDGIWLAFHDNKIGLITGWPGTKMYVSEFSFASMRHVLIEDDTVNNVITVYIKEGGESQLVCRFVIQNEHDVKVYDNKGDQKITHTLGHDLNRDGFICFWAPAGNMGKSAFDNIEIRWEEKVRAEYTPTDPETLQDLYSDTWVGMDDENRLVADGADDIDDKLVGIFYQIWHVQTGTTYPDQILYDHHAIYQEGGHAAVKEAYGKGPVGWGHYWGQPYFGYYLTNDQWVIRKHASMLCDIGVDFIYLDVTNGNPLTTSYMAIFKEYKAMREMGMDTPDICFFMADDASLNPRVFEDIWDNIYSTGQYSDLYVMYKGKPLLLGNVEKIEDKEALETFTVRRCWALRDNVNKGKDMWTWMHERNQPISTYNGEPEEISISAAILANLGMGRSNTKGRQPKLLTLPDGTKDIFQFELETTGQGLFFAEQMQRAAEADTYVLLINAWNEWGAGRWEGNSYPTIANTHIDWTYSYYVDCFNPEFSRDIEPMAGGFGDNYYYQLAQFLRAFKGSRNAPEAAGQNEMDMKADLSAWDSVWPEYMDTEGDTFHRDALGFGGFFHYTNTTGRNDIISAKVSKTDNNTYFLAVCADKITSPEGSNWMNLFINTDCDYDTGWYGYDIVINRDGAKAAGGKVTIEKFVGNAWKLESIGEGEITINGNYIVIKVDTKLCSLSGDFDFKWADNSTTDGEIMQFLDLGDAAPNARFNYAYRAESAAPTFNDTLDAYLAGGAAFDNGKAYMAADNGVFRLYDGNTNAKAQMYKGRLFAPVTALSNLSGASVELAADGKSATWTYNGKKVVFTADSTDVMVDIDTCVIPVAPFVENGVLYVPLNAAAFIAELNYYSNADGTSAILSPKAEAPEGTDADRLFNALDRSF